MNQHRQLQIQRLDNTSIAMGSFKDSIPSNDVSVRREDQPIRAPCNNLLDGANNDILKTREHDRKVTFSKIQVREYERVVGDHPNAVDGPPIAIGWRYVKRPSYTLEDYENDCVQRKRGSSENGHAEEANRTKKLQPLAGFVRRNMCLYDLKVSEKEIENAIKESEKIQRQRLRSFRKQQAVENIITSPFIQRIGKTLPWVEMHHDVSGQGGDYDRRDLSRTFRGAVKAVVFGVSTLKTARDSMSEAAENDAKIQERAIENDSTSSVEVNSNNIKDGKENSVHERGGRREISRKFRAAVRAVMFSSSTLDGVRKKSSDENHIEEQSASNIENGLGETDEKVTPMEGSKVDNFFDVNSCEKERFREIEVPPISFETVDRKHANDRRGRRELSRIFRGAVRAVIFSSSVDKSSRRSKAPPVNSRGDSFNEMNDTSADGDGVMKATLI